MLIEIGTQIAYIPDHARGDINHQDVEFGFVVSQGSRPTYFFCRYWHQGKPGVMRTTANSELTNVGNLRIHKSVPQEVVNQWLKKPKEE